MSGPKRRDSDTIPIPVEEIRARLREIYGDNIDQPYQPIADDDTPTSPCLIEDPSEETLTRCLECGGHFRWEYTSDGVERILTCRWCTRGAMDSVQLAAWNARKNGRPPKE